MGTYLCFVFSVTKIVAIVVENYDHYYPFGITRAQIEIESEREDEDKVAIWALFRVYAPIPREISLTPTKSLELTNCAEPTEYISTMRKCPDNRNVLRYVQIDTCPMGFILDVTRGS